jgi:hypothetical protein
LAGAGLIYYTTTTGPSSTYNSSNGGATPSAGGDYWASSVYFPDIMRNPFNLSVAVTSTSAGQTFNAEYSFDDYTSSAWVSSAATWFVLSGISSATSNVTGNIAYPVRAVRLNVTAGVAGVPVRMCVIQAAGD